MWKWKPTFSVEHFWKYNGLTFDESYSVFTCADRKGEARIHFLKGLRATTCWENEGYF